MALYIPHSIFHLAQLLYVRPETFGPYYVLVQHPRFPEPSLRNADLEDPLFQKYRIDHLIRRDL